jgi:BirA family biotin operon repressor/biotin-[acetyl-CoA-carboxylase] ligase
MTAVPAQPPLPLAWVDEIASTQVELVARARTGAAPQALATTSQTAGHGRRGRDWSCPPGAGLALSVLVRPNRDDAWTWLPLLAGVAVVDALDAMGATGLTLKWPNDVLASAGKLAGLIAERVDSPSGPGARVPAFVLGVGINLSSDGLPSTATCLHDLGVEADARLVGDAVLTSLVRWTQRWVDDPAEVASAYRECCATVGRDVRVSLPGGRDVLGRAVAIDDAGCLVVESGSGPQPLSAGDVVHLREQ